MNLIKIEQKYIDEITGIAYRTYQEEYKYIDGIPMWSMESMQERIAGAMDSMQGYLYFEQGEMLGYLIYTVNGSELEKNCSIPIWGYGAIGDQREKILSRLFQKIANDECKDQKVHFDIRLYAHDESIIRLFSFLQFGIQCEEGIYSTEKNICSEFETQICELTKQELEQNWDEVWSMVASIIHHLQESPIFYPGGEFTEQLYKDFFIDADTQVYVARKNHRMIGLIETNGEKNEMIGDGESSMNIGEAYVVDEYRGKGIAQELLNYASNSVRAKGIHYLWVEHGTANPNARGFWNKYFHTYSYTMIRDIDGRIESDSLCLK